MNILSQWGVTAVGYAAAATLLTLYIGAKGDIKAEIERCNTEKMVSVNEAIETLRDAQIANYEDRLNELRQLAIQEAEARRIAEQAALEAANKPERVRTVIKEIASANACIDTAMPAAVLDSLR